MLFKKKSFKEISGFFLILLLAFPIRIWIPFGPFASFSIIDIYLLSIMFIAVIDFIIKLKIPTGNRHISIALAIPVLLTFLSLLWTSDYDQTVKSVLIYSEALVIYFVTIWIFKDLNNNKIINYLAIFVIALILTSLLSLMHIPGFSPENIINNQINKKIFLLSYYSRLSHPFIGLSNNFASVLAFFPLMFYTHGEMTNMKKYKWLALLSLTFILLTLSKGVIIALIITFLIYFSNIKLLRRSTKYILFATIFIAFFLYIYINYYPSVFEQIYNRFGYHSVGIRYDIIVESIRLIQNKPIIGYGGGIIYSDIIGTNINVTATHNTFIQQIIYFGIPIGIILSFSLLYLFIHFLILARQNRHNEIFYRARTIAIVILGQLIIFLTESSFEGSVLRLIFYFSIASFVSLISATKRELSL